MIALVVFAVAFVLNLVVAVPPEGWAIPLAGPLGIAGAGVMTVVAGVAPAEQSATGPDAHGGISSGTWANRSFSVRP